MKSDYLNKVVQALDKGQLRFCREQFSQSQGANAQLELQIFNAATQTTSGQDLTKLVPNAKHLATLKKRVYYNVIDFVDLLEDHRRAKQDPLHKYKEAKALLTLSIHDEALDVLQKGIERAVALEEIFTEVRMRELLREILKNLTAAKYEKLAVDNEYHLETAARKQLDVIRLTFINDRMFRYYRSFRSSKNLKYVQAIEDLKNSDDLAEDAIPDSLPAQLRYFNALNIYYSAKGQPLKAIDMMKRQLKLWQSNQLRIEFYPHMYMSCLNNLIGKLNMSYQITYAKAHLQTLENFNPKGKRNQVLKFEYLTMQSQLLMMNEGKVSEACDYEEVIQKGLSTYEKSVSLDFRYVLTFNMAIAQLVNGNNRRALFHFNAIKELGFSAVRHDIQGMARIFRLLLLADDDSTGTFPHQLRNSDRFFKKKHPGYALEQAVFKWVKQFHARLITDRKASYTVLHQCVDPFANSGVIGAQELQLWAKSKAGNRSMKTLYASALAEQAEQAG